MNQIVINGNNIEVLKQFPDNHFDSIVTDPPYGLGKEPDPNELMKDWLENGYHEIQGKGFMGKEWDAFVPQPIFWKEIFRVLKHGGHVVAFYGTRTYDWGVMAMRFAGFEVRDCIQWLYGSGFPKSHNISKAIDKMYGAEREVVGQRQDILVKQAKDIREGKRKILESFNNGSPERNNGFVNVSADVTKASTEEAKLWDGWGSALKPANEPIVLARKPLEKGLSIAENVLKWGTGAINIDECRIGKKEGDRTEYGVNGIKRSNNNNVFGKQYGEIEFDGTNGRFPANIILTHHPECECKQNEELEDWNCHPDCPIKVLDEQSGISKSTGGRIGNKNGAYSGIGAIGFTTEFQKGDAGFGDKGGASRFFYVAKASKSERNKGLEGFEEKQTIGGGGISSPTDENGNIIVSGDKGMAGKYGSAKAISKNFHPTVKPVKLMQYLVRLVTPPNGKVLDPYCGSGTTGIACKLEGFDFVGIEQDEEYCKIAESRISNYFEDKEPIKEQEVKSTFKQSSLF